MTRRCCQDAPALTIDADPWKSRFGSQRHIVAGLEDLAAHVQPGGLDLILCNGVVGWGLADPDGCEQAFGACSWPHSPTACSTC